MILVVGTHAARSHFLESAPLTCQELPPALYGPNSPHWRLTADAALGFHVGPRIRPSAISPLRIRRMGLILPQVAFGWASDRALARLVINHADSPAWRRNPAGSP
jgi:hypothetical protein